VYATSHNEFESELLSDFNFNLSLKYSILSLTHAIKGKKCLTGKLIMVCMHLHQDQPDFNDLAHAYHIHFKHPSESIAL